MSLSELLERVKAASGPDREIDCALACHLDGFWANLKLWPSRPIGANLMEWRLDFCCRDPDGGGIVSPGHGGDQMVRKYTASIDAAVALIERVLPGCRFELLISEDGSGHVTLRLGSEDTGPLSHWATAPTPPLALIIALLEAKIAEEKP